MRSIFYNLVIILSLVSPCTIFSARIIQGDKDAIGTSFSFPILKYAYDKNSLVFFVGARTAVADNGFALSGAGGFDTAFTPLAPEKVTLNNNEDSTNPLFGAAIEHLAIAGNRPFAVTAAEPDRLVLVYNFTNMTKIGVLQSDELLSADPFPTPIGSILALVSNGGQTLVSGGTVLFAFVTPPSNIFGDDGSGLARVIYAEPEVNGKKTYQLISGPTIAIDRTTAALNVGAGTLTAMTNTVSPHWSELVLPTVVNEQGQIIVPQQGSLYTGFQVTSGVASGAKSVLFNTSSIVANSAITADSIIATSLPNTQVSVNHLSTIITSTGLAYLIVVGGVGSPSATDRSIFALPLVNDPASTSFGTLANINSPVEHRFKTTQPFLFEGNYFTTPATNPGELFTSTDFAAQVGGGLPLPGPITALFTQGDAIIVATQSDTGPGGIFISQALFQEDGSIKGWTQWRATSGNQEPMFGVTLDAQRGIYWLIPGNDINNLQTVEVTQWSEQGDGLALEAQNFFKQSEGGVQGFVDIPERSYNGTSISYMIATGFKKAMLFVSSTNGTPTPEFSNCLEALNGTVGAIGTSSCIAFSGGTLESMNALITATIGINGNDAWLFVGGTGGVAVLTQDDGSGSLPAGNATWRTLGNYKNVRKLFFDGSDINNPYLYILTDTQLDRILVAPTAFGVAGNLQATTLAESSVLFPDNGGTFSDVVVSGAVALLATSRGLYQNAINTNAAQLTSSANAWSHIKLNESPGAATRLYVVSPTAFDYNFATNSNGGNIYVLSAGVSASQAHAYRFAIQPDNPVTANTVVQLPDYFVKNLKSFIANFSNYRNYISFDGALFFASRSRYVPTGHPPFQELLAQPIRSGTRFVNRNALPVLVLINANAIGPVVKRSATGALIVRNDTGLEINE